MVLMFYVLKGQADVLHHHHVLGADLGGPVLVTLLLLLFDQLVQHQHGFALLLPHHQPEVADGVDQGALRQYVLSVCLVNFDEVRVDVVGGAATEDDSAVVVGADVSIPVQVFVLRLEGFCARTAVFGAFRSDFLEGQIGGLSRSEHIPIIGQLVRKRSCLIA